jgi:hypothetical protein
MRLLIVTLGYRVPQQEHWAVSAPGPGWLPLTTIVGREIAIRMLKPALRAGMPTASVL